MIHDDGIKTRARAVGNLFQLLQIGKRERLDECQYVCFDGIGAYYRQETKQKESAKQHRSQHCLKSIATFDVRFLKCRRQAAAVLDPDDEGESSHDDV
jgi:hypothetical protein